MKYTPTQIFIILILILSVQNFFGQNDTASYLLNPNYKIKLDLYDIYRTRSANIVMLGNSITDGADWSELLGRKDVISRGIVSDNTEGYLNRLQNVIKLNPKIVFILGGINDIYSWVPVEKIYNNYVNIISRLRAAGITPVIQSTLYTAENWGERWNLTPEINADRNKEVDKLNELLKEFAAQNNIEFIDLNSLLSQGNFLNNEFTLDGIHLNANAYKIWALEIEKILLKNDL